MSHMQQRGLLRQEVERESKKKAELGGLVSKESLNLGSHPVGSGYWVLESRSRTQAPRGPVFCSKNCFCQLFSVHF